MMRNSTWSYSRDRYLGWLRISSWQTEGCHMRCFKDNATTGTGSFDAEDLQLIFPHFAQEGFIGAKVTSKLFKICMFLNYTLVNSHSNGNGPFEDSCVCKWCACPFEARFLLKARICCWYVSLLAGTSILAFHDDFWPTSHSVADGLRSCRMPDSGIACSHCDEGKRRKLWHLVTSIFSDLKLRENGIKKNKKITTHHKTQSWTLLDEALALLFGLVFFLMHDHLDFHGLQGDGNTWRLEEVGWLAAVFRPIWEKSAQLISCMDRSVFSHFPAGFKGQLGVPLTVYPWYLLCCLGILGDLGDYNP